MLNNPRNNSSPRSCAGVGIAGLNKFINLVRLTFMAQSTRKESKNQGEINWLIKVLKVN